MIHVKSKDEADDDYYAAIKRTAQGDNITIANQRRLSATTGAIECIEPQPNPKLSLHQHLGEDPDRDTSPPSRVSRKIDRYMNVM